MGLFRTITYMSRKIKDRHRHAPKVLSKTIWKHYGWKRSIIMLHNSREFGFFTCSEYLNKSYVIQSYNIGHIDPSFQWRHSGNCLSHQSYISSCAPPLGRRRQRCCPPPLCSVCWERGGGARSPSSVPCPCSVPVPSPGDILWNAGTFNKQKRNTV